MELSHFDMLVAINQQLNKNNNEVKVTTQINDSLDDLESPLIGQK